MRAAPFTGYGDPRLTRATRARAAPEIRPSIPVAHGSRVQGGGRLVNGKPSAGRTPLQRRARTMGRTGVAHRGRTPRPAPGSLIYAGGGLLGPPPPRLACPRRSAVSPADLHSPSLPVRVLGLLRGRPARALRPGRAAGKGRYRLGRCRLGRCWLGRCRLGRCRLGQCRLGREPRGPEMRAGPGEPAAAGHGRAPRRRRRTFSGIPAAVGHGIGSASHRRRRLWLRRIRPPGRRTSTPQIAGPASRRRRQSPPPVHGA